MSRLRRVALVGAVVLWTAFVALLVLSGASSQGPVFISFTPDHGVHVGDAVVAVVWVAGLLVALDLARRG